MRALPKASFMTYGNKPVDEKPHFCFLCDRDSRRYYLSGESFETAKPQRASWRHMAEIWNIRSRAANLTSLGWLNRRLQQKYLGVKLQDLPSVCHELQLFVLFWTIMSQWYSWPFTVRVCSFLIGWVQHLLGCHRPLLPVLYVADSRSVNLVRFLLNCQQIFVSERVGHAVAKLWIIWSISQAKPNYFLILLFGERHKLVGKDIA